MSAKILLILTVLGLLSACAAPSPGDLETPSPTMEVEISPTPHATASLPPNASSSFDCGNVQEIPVDECQSLVTLYESTNGDAWEDHSGWLANPTPCTWVGVMCQQGHIVELQLYYNNLTGSLPPEIGNLTQLKSLYLDQNQLSGPVPAEIGNLSQLQVARLGGNQFNSIPAEITHLKKLIFLELWGNQLSGEIPEELGNLSKLQVLSLHANQFTGSIPPELGKLTNLTNLNLSKNQLSGPIPPAFGDLAILNELILSFNQLTGPIPAELGNLTNLYLLDLSYNQLTGEVPAALAKASISDIRLWGNQLDGTVPVSKEETTAVDYQGVHFEINSDLAESVWPEVVAAQPSIEGSPGWGVSPEYIRFSIAGTKEQGYSHSNLLGVATHPQILIYPAGEFSELSEFAKQEIEGLQSLLENRPSIPGDKLPFLPLVNAAQAFHAQEKYVDFQNGSSVRFITQYSQDMGPITNKNIFYTFQGLTRDGKYYVAALFPITASGLSDEPVVENWDTVAADYQNYLNENISSLNALSSEEFEPDLDSLDQLIETMVVAP